jgi:hypothetical protein
MIERHSVEDMMEVVFQSAYVLLVDTTLGLSNGKQERHSERGGCLWNVT